MDILTPMTTDTLRVTSLYDTHVQLGGRMVPFAGYSMPVQYAGIVAESRAVREGAGMFDVSHMARFSIQAENVIEFLEWVTTNDVAKLGDFQGQYSLLPNASGGVVDDVILYRISYRDFRMVVNASNHQTDFEWLKAQDRWGIAIEDVTEVTSMIAVQGPQAVEILASNASNAAALRDAPMFGVTDVTIFDAPCFAARSGYTGEDGYELILPNQYAPELWAKLLEAGVSPCGLGSRDVLRVEAGLPLYGHELGPDINPISAGLGWVIGKEKQFIGKEHVDAARANGTPRKLQGVKLSSKRLPMRGMRVLVDGREVGELSSGVFSPMLECGIAFAFIDRDVKLNTPCHLDIRGTEEPATIVGKRFYKPQR